MAGEGCWSLLLALPDPCLLKVLQCCAADDQRGLFSAARSHRRLHQAAVAALHTLKARLSQQQQVECVTRYLDKYGNHVSCLDLKGDADRPRAIELCQVPPNLQLSSLQLSYLGVQLQPNDSFRPARGVLGARPARGVLGAAAQVAGLKQLQLKACSLLDAEKAEALAAALSQLVELVHLSISDMQLMNRSLQLPTSVLQRLQQLTYLELARIRLCGPDDQSCAALQPLQALTRLVDLRLADAEAGDDRIKLTASMLSGTHHLTHLKLSHCSIEPGVLTGKTQLQHLHLAKCSMLGAVSGEPAAMRMAQFLSLLKPLQQLQHLQVTHINLVLRGADRANPLAAAMSALTASNKLEELDISWCTLPAGVWQHLFPAGRQLPVLQGLDVSYVQQPFCSHAPPPEGSLLVSCCPGLQSVDMRGLQCSAELLAPLQGLSGLHTLSLSVDDRTAGEGVQAVCQLTGLRQLRVNLPRSADVEGLQQLQGLTQLQQLTAFTLDGTWAVLGCQARLSLTSKAPGDEPVWRQLQRQLELHVPRGPQQADAALTDAFSTAFSAAFS